jgi:O-antigen ligase
MEKLNLFLKNNSYESLFIVFVLGGYVVASGLAIPLGIENSRLFAVPYRVLIFLMSLYFIFKGIKEKKINIAVVSTIAFWLFYVVKNYYSLTNHYYKQEILPSLQESYVRIFVIALIPSLALLNLNFKKIDLRKTGKILFLIYFLMLFFNTVYGIFHIQNGVMGHIFSIYYISYGHLGTSLVLMSTYFLFFTEPKKRDKFIYGLGLLLGLFIIIEGFARSPFLALVVVSVYYLVVLKKEKYFYFFITFMLFIISYIYLSEKYGFNRLIFVERTYNWIFNGDTSLRMPLFEKGWNIFRENPILGGRVLFEDGMYPHNIFLELLMATGIIGFVLYMLKYVPLVKSWKFFFCKKKDSGEILFFALFLQYFVLVCTSYSLYSTPEFLHLSAVIIALSLYFIYEKTKSNDRRWDAS